MKQASKTLIGVFIIGAVAFAVAGVVIFGSGRFFKEANLYVIYFSGSVKGLQAGAPVTFRGTKMGEVKDIISVFDYRDLSMHIPVIIEFDQSKYKVIAPEQKREHLDLMIEKGLRGRLEMQSLVTGQLLVDFDLYPDTPVNLVGKDLPDLGINFRELPSIESDIQKLAKKIEDLPIEQIANEAFELITDFRQLIKSEDVAENLAVLHRVLENADKLAMNADKFVNNVNSQVDPLVNASLETIKDLRLLAKNTDQRTGPTINSIRKVAEEATVSLRQARKTLKTADEAMTERSPLRLELSDTLNEIADAARSVRILAEYIEQNPDALLRGK
jgi:paraquat-inducible protein B